MKLNKITIQGFRSFNSRQVFEFLSNGLYYISGRNLLEPRLGRNGAGKSTIFEALCWVLFGKTSINVKAGNVKNWKKGTEKCEVELFFKRHGKEYSLYRSISPNRLTVLVDEKITTITQDDLESLIGLNFQSFLFSVFVSQFSSKFFDLDPAPKLEVFSQTLNLDKWLTYSEEASKKRKTNEHLVVSKKVAVEKLQGSLEELTSQDYETKNKEWEEKRKERLVEAENNSQQGALKIVTLKKDLKGFEKTVKHLKNEVTKIEAEIEKITEPLDDLEAEKSKYATDWGIKRAAEETIESQLKKLKTVGAVCSECRQKVTKAHLEKERKALEAALKIAGKELALVITMHGEVTGKRAVIISAEKTLDDIVYKKLKELAKPTMMVTNHQVKIQVTETENKNSKLKTEEIKKETNPYKKQYLESKERKRTLVKEIRACNKHASDFELKVELFTYWQKAFKQIRLFVIKEALDELEIQMNNSLDQLGLEGWEIHLAIDRETKGGGISRGFTIFIYSPINETLVPFGCWSGGEAQRLKMAGTLALADFIRSRTGEDWNLEAFDEPTAWLGKEGIEDMLEVLSARSKNSDRPIYIIDHRDFETFGGFNREIEVVKDKDGSRINMEQE